MSSSRARLKSASEALAAERFSDAAKICQSLLAESPDNYNACVFLGAAYEGLKRDEDALTCYRDATKQQPKQLLGWKAVAKYCESHHDRQLKQELPDVYDKVLELTDPADARHPDTLFKLMELLCRQRHHRRAVDAGRLWLSRYTASEARARLQLRLLDTMAEAADSVPNEEIFGEFESVLSQPASILARADDANSDHNQLLSQLHRRHCDLLAQRGADTERRLLALANAVNQCPDDVELIDRLAFAKAERGIVCQGWRLQRLAKHFALVKVEGSLAKQFGNQVVASALHRDLANTLAAVASPSWSLPYPPPIDPSAAVTAPSGCLVSSLVRILCAKATRRFADCLAAIDNLQAVYLAVSQHRKLYCFSSRVELLDGWLTRIRWRCLACYADEQRLSVDELASMSAAASGEDVNNDEEEDTHYSAAASLAISLSRLGRQQEAHAAWPNRQGLTGRRVEAFIAFQSGDFARARQLLEELIALPDSNSDEAGSGYRRPWDRLMLARCLWSMAQPGSALSEIANQLLLCIEEDRYYADAYYWYGCYAEDVTGDDAVANQMYSQAHQLDGDHEAALKRLCDLLLRLHREADCVELLTTFAARFYRVSPWCYFTLGLAHLNMANYHEAIDCLQRVVHQDKANPHAWTCLGEAYRLRGSFESAGKVFERVVRLSPGDWYARLQLASVLHKQRLFYRAIDLLNQLLDEQLGCDDVGDGKISLRLMACKQLAESHLQLGIDLSVKGQHMSAARHLVLSANSSCDAVHIDSKPVCVWKLLGDSLYRLGIYESAELNSQPFSQQLLRMLSNTDKLSAAESSVQCSTGLSQPLVLQGCISAYASRLEQVQALVAKGGDNGQSTEAGVQRSATGQLECNARLDCSLVLLRVARVAAANRRHYIPTDGGQSVIDGGGGVGRESQALYEAMQHCELALKLKPNRPDAWYIMGLIQAQRERRPLAQHCFIKSLDLDPGQAEVWTALGLFYCQLDKLEHGAACFRKAIDADPTMSAAWASCAIVARIEGKQSQMRDLLRHACSLPNPPLEALREFTHCVAMEITKRLTGNESYSSQFGSESQQLSLTAIDALAMLAIQASESTLPLAQSLWHRLGLLNHRLLCLERLGLVRASATVASDLLQLALDDMRLAENVAEEEAAAAAFSESSLELRATISNCLRCLTLAGEYSTVAARASYLQEFVGSDLSAQDMCYIGFSVAKSSSRDSPDALEKLEIATWYFSEAVERVTVQELAGSVWATVMAAAEHLDNPDTGTDAMGSALELAPKDAGVVRCVLAYVSLRLPKMVAPGLEMLRSLLPEATAKSDPQLNLYTIFKACSSGEHSVAIATAVNLLLLARSNVERATAWIAALRTSLVISESSTNGSLKSLSCLAVFEVGTQQLARLTAPIEHRDYVGNYIDEVFACLTSSENIRAACTNKNGRTRSIVQRLCAAAARYPTLSLIVDLLR